MADISEFTHDELEFITSLEFTVTFFRKYIAAHEDEFLTFFPNHRPYFPSYYRKTNMSNQLITNLIKNNLYAPPVANGLQHCIGDLFISVHTRIKRETSSHGFNTAVCKIISGSYFAHHIDFYLKLAEKYCSSEYVAKLENVLRNRKIENIDKESLSLAPNYPDVILDTKDSEDTILEVHENMKKPAEQEIKKNVKHSTASGSEESSTNEEYPFSSLCRVRGSSGKTVELLRMVDIQDGMIQPQRRSDAPDRDILYTQDGINHLNFVGIWNWRVGYNSKTGQQNFVFSSYEQELEPTEVILSINAKTITELKEILLQGIEVVPSGNKAIFAFFADGRYVGLLCTSKNLLIQNGQTQLKADVASLPIYEFSLRETVRVNNLLFLSHIDLGPPSSFLRIIDPLEAVKNAVLSRSPIAKLKSWMTIREAREMRTFLQEMPTSDFYQEIADACACSLDEAQAYADEFIQRAGAYLQGDDIESEILESAMNHSPNLLEKCRSLNEKVWRKENEVTLQKADSALKEVEQRLQETEGHYNQLLAQQKQLETRLEHLASEIEQKQELEKSIDQKIAGRIDMARKNVSEFISEITFLQPLMSGQTQSVDYKKKAIFQSGVKLSGYILENYEPMEVVCTIQEELEQAGVANQYSLEFASFLYAAYTTHSPLLLLGPNGHDIADALSTALFGKTASVLCCENEYAPDAIEACVNDEGQVVAVLNPFHTDWINHIAEITVIKEKFVITVHPFAEDMIIEPRGIYNYVLPVLTELFVERTATNNFAGGCLGEGFKPYVHVKPQQKIPLAEKLALPPLAQNRLRQILADMKTFSKSGCADIDILFGILPYAYVTGKSEVIWEELQNNCPLSKDAKKLIQTFLGDLDQ